MNNLYMFLYPRPNWVDSENIVAYRNLILINKKFQISKAYALTPTSGYFI